MKLKSKDAVLNRLGYGSIYLSDFFDFSKFEENTNKAAVEKEMAKIRPEFSKAKDEIMLGDSKEALKLLSDLESKFACK